MERPFLIFGIVIGIGLSFLLLNWRKRKWFNNAKRFIITGSLCIIGIIGLKVANSDNPDLIVFFKLIQLPFWNSIIDRVLKKISLQIHGRDLFLNIKGSEDETLQWPDPRIKTSDNIFTQILVISHLGLPIIIAITN